MRRVVVTGLGMVTPLGSGVEVSWKNALAGKSGARTIEKFDASHLGTGYACEVPRGTEPGQFNADAFMPAKDARKVDDFILYGMAAAQMAVEDADWTPDGQDALERTGVMIGSGIGGLSSCLLYTSPSPRD